MNWTVMIVVIVLCLPLYWMLGKSFFGSWEGVLEALVALLVGGPKWGDRAAHVERHFGRLTVIWYVGICVFSTAAFYHMVAKFLLGIEKPWG
jgi:hypothetical protein